MRRVSLILCLWANIWPVDFINTIFQLPWPLQLVHLSWYMVSNKTPSYNHLKMYSFIYLNLFCMTDTQPLHVLQSWGSQGRWSKPGMSLQAATHHYSPRRRERERCIHAGKWIKCPFPRHFCRVYVNMCAGETTTVSLPGRESGPVAIWV